MKPHLYAFMALSITLIFACAGAQEVDRRTNPDGELITPDNLNAIAGVEWNLINMTVGSEPVALGKDSETTFSCDEDGKVAGKATINRYAGSLKLQEDGDITWSKTFIMTRMAGPPELMEQESIFTQALMKTSRMYHQESKLVMISPDRSTVLEFEAAG